MEQNVKWVWNPCCGVKGKVTEGHPKLFKFTLWGSWIFTDLLCRGPECWRRLNSEHSGCESTCAAGIQSRVCAGLKLALSVCCGSHWSCCLSVAGVKLLFTAAGGMLIKSRALHIIVMHKQSIWIKWEKTLSIRCPPHLCCRLLDCRWKLQKLTHCWWHSDDCVLI